MPGQFRTTLGCVGRKWPGPTWIEFDATLVDSGSYWPMLVEFVPNRGLIRPHFCQVRPGFGHFRLRAPLPRAQATRLCASHAGRAEPSPTPSCDEGLGACKERGPRRYAAGASVAPHCGRGHPDFSNRHFGMTKHRRRFLHTSSISTFAFFLGIPESVDESMKVGIRKPPKLRRAPKTLEIPQAKGSVPPGSLKSDRLCTMLDWAFECRTT